MYYAHEMYAIQAASLTMPQLLPIDERRLYVRLSCAVCRSSRCAGRYYSSRLRLINDRLYTVYGLGRLQIVASQGWINAAAVEHREKMFLKTHAHTQWQCRNQWNLLKVVNQRYRSGFGQRLIYRGAESAPPTPWATHWRRHSRSC